MSASKESLREFQALYRTKFGEELSDKDLDRKARLLLNLYIAIYKSPIDIIRKDTLANNYP